MAPSHSCSERRKHLLRRGRPTAEHAARVPICHPPCLHLQPQQGTRAPVAPPRLPGASVPPVPCPPGTPARRPQAWQSLGAASVLIPGSQRRCVCVRERERVSERVGAGRREEGWGPALRTAVSLVMSAVSTGLPKSTSLERATVSLPSASMKMVTDMQAGNLLAGRAMGLPASKLFTSKLARVLSMSSKESSLLSVYSLSTVGSSPATARRARPDRRTCSCRL